MNPWKEQTLALIGAASWVCGILLLILAIILMKQIGDREQLLKQTLDENMELRIQRDSIQIEYYKLLGVKELK